VPTQNSNNPVQSGGVYSANQTLTSAFVNNVNVNGSKNRFIFDIEEIIQNNTGGTWSGNTFTKGGATFTIDGDSVIFSGTPTGYVNFIFYQKISKPAIYELSGLKDCTNVLFGGCTLYLNGSQVGSIVINSKNDTTLDLSAYTFDTISIDVKREANNVAISGTAFIMLCLKSDYDLDPTYIPPAKTNQQLTRDKVGMDLLSEVGAVNQLLIKTSGDTILSNGVYGTYNSDNTITLHGTATNDLVTSVEEYKTFKAGTYKLSGAPSMGSSDSLVSLTMRTSSNTIYGGARNDTDGVIFTLPTDTALKLVIYVKRGTNVEGKVVKPMLTPVSYNGSYVPPAKTNKELTDELKVTACQIERLVSFSSISSYYARKYGKVVELYFAGTLSEAVNIWTDFLMVPEGFRPSHYVQIVSFNAYNSCKNLQLAPSGGIQSAYNLVAGDYIRFTVTYIID
jgi:hypothetical protein